MLNKYYIIILEYFYINMNVLRYPFLRFLRKGMLRKIHYVKQKYFTFFLLSLQNF